MTLFWKFFKYWLVLGITAGISAGVWAIVWGSMNWHRGIYAGFHGNDARKWGARQLLDQYGPAVANSLQYRGEQKTHFDAGFGPQVRILRFSDPQGIPYCAFVWGGNRGQYVAHRGAACGKF